MAVFAACTGFARADGPTHGIHTFTRDDTPGPFARKLLATGDANLRRISQGAKQGLIELASVNLPTNPRGDNDHFGWPVAVAVDARRLW